VYTTHQSFLDDVLYKFTYLLTYVHITLVFINFTIFINYLLPCCVWPVTFHVIAIILYLTLSQAVKF